VTAQSGPGQGDKTLYEGVVLPANGDPWTPEQQRQVAQTQPPSGQPWGEPWGPESPPAVTSGADGSAALPPMPSHSPPNPPAPPADPPAQQPLMVEPPMAEAPMVEPPNAELQPQSQPLSTDGASAPPRGRHRSGDPQPHTDTPLHEQPYAAALPSAGYLGQASAPVAAPAAAAAHTGQALYGEAHLQQHAPPPPPSPPTHAQQPQAQPMPHAQPQPEAQPTAQAPSVAQPQTQPQTAGVLPPPVAPAPPAEAPQYIPPANAPSGAGQQPGSMPPFNDADATQMLPQQTGQARDSEATTMLRSPLPPEAGSAKAGQFGTGVSGHAQQRRQTPAEFDSLFRADPPAGAAGGDGSPGTTQSLPLFDHAAARQNSAGPGAHAGHPRTAAPAGPDGPGAKVGHGRAARRNADRGLVSRMTPGVLIGLGVVLVAALGMAAGAALSGKDDGGDAGKSSAARTADEKAKKSGLDPAVKTQAKQLDELLDDSNNSRTTVVTSVENIKSCKKLGQAASDLRAAAGQRNGLVARLGKLETDKIPSGEKLTSALTRAWKSSAAADDHYATWANQTSAKKGCKKGKARVTQHTGAGSRASGEATTAKKEAAGLWNPTASKYGLKERKYNQL
jgi:hypothetical protein